MAFFLILAVIGVVGAGGTYIYQLRAKPSANSPEENQAAAPVSAAPAQNVTKPLIPPGQTIVAAQQLADKVSTIEKRTLSAYETEKRLRLIDEVFLPMLRGEIVEHVRRGYQLQSNWSNFVHSDRVKYIQDLQDFRRKSEEWNVKLGTARRDNAAFEDVISLTEPTYAQPFFDSMNNFIGMIGAMGDPPYKFDMQYIVGPKSETFQKGIQALGDWLFVTEKKIIERRKEIATP
jgi:hypothetical protein